MKFFGDREAVAKDMNRLDDDLLAFERRQPGFDLRETSPEVAFDVFAVLVAWEEEE